MHIAQDLTTGSVLALRAVDNLNLRRTFRMAGPGAASGATCADDFDTGSRSAVAGGTTTMVAFGELCLAILPVRGPS